MTNAVYLASLVNSTGYNVTLSGATVSSGTGVAFPATQSASSDANTLDDYEEGTWTPTLTFGGGSTGITYSSERGGAYTRIGRLVYINLRLTLTSKGSSTGDAKITGLPFAPNAAINGDNPIVTSTMWWNGLTSLPVYTTRIDANSNYLQVRGENTGSEVAIDNTYFANSCSIAVTLTYTTST